MQVHHGICNFIGTIVCVGQALLISLLISPVVNLKLIIILGVVIFIWSYYIIYKLAPVDSDCKAYSKRRKKKADEKRIYNTFKCIFNYNSISYLVVY